MSAAVGTRLAWHYVTAADGARIFETGCLEPRYGMVWFSCEPHWDPMALYKDLTIEETARCGNGLYRFGYPAQRLIPWPKIAKLAGWNAEDRREVMRDSRRAHGGDPTWIHNHVLWALLASA
jgi:hypothetical protein